MELGEGALDDPASNSQAGAEAQFLRQVFPGDRGVRDEQDALENGSVRMPFMSGVQGPALSLGQQRLDHRPQLVIDFPRLRPSHLTPPCD